MSYLRVWAFKMASLTFLTCETWLLNMSQVIRIELENIGGSYLKFKF